MLKKPYKLIHSEGASDYHLMMLDNIEVFLGVLNIGALEYKKKNKVKVKKMLSKMNTLKLDSGLLWLFITILSMATEHKEETFEDDVDTYAEFTEQDNKDVIAGFKAFAQESEATLDNIEFIKFPKNPVVKGFIKDSFHYYLTTHTSILTRTHLLYRVSKFGVLQVVEVEEVGANEDTITREVNSYILGRDLMAKIIINIEHRYGGE